MTLELKKVQQLTCNVLNQLHLIYIHVMWKVEFDQEPVNLFYYNRCNAALSLKLQQLRKVKLT